MAWMMMEMAMPTTSTDGTFTSTTTIQARRMQMTIMERRPPESLWPPEITDSVWLGNITLSNGAVEQFDTLGLPSGWSTSGNANWSVVDKPARAFGTGRYEAKAGTITHNQTNALRSPTIHVTSTGDLVYWAWT